jgi:allantoicase
MRLEELNAMAEPDAVSELLRCCGSTRWARQMTAARPFADSVSLAATADIIWRSLGRSDWLEAFAAHPRIGASDAFAAAGRPQSGGLRGGDQRWSRQEQAGVAAGSNEVRQRLVQRNRDYETRFGYIFIVCATGKSADEMLALLESRLTHDSDDELRIAAEEQRRITALRLAKLLGAERVAATSIGRVEVPVVDEQKRAPREGDPREIKR